MKILILFLFLIAFIISAGAQEKKIPQVKPEIESRDDAAPQVPFNYHEPESLALSHESRHLPEFPMPVAKSTTWSRDNMPVSVPDSTVHFFILQKHIKMINPLEQSGR